MNLPKYDAIKQHLNNNGIVYAILGLAIVVVIISIVFGFSKMNLNKTDNKAMSKGLERVPVKIGSFSTHDGNYEHKLRDYYVMSSYNSCCNGDFNNSYVDYEPLKMVIRRGARVLDFEVYSVNDETVIAAGPTDNYYMKGTYNSLPFAEVMSKVNSYAFSHGTCPNAEDPLFLHFRIKSKKPHVYEDMTKSIYQTFLHRKLGNEYSYESHGENLGLVPLKDLRGKVVIMCSRANNMFEKTPLNEYVNIASGSQFLRELRNYDVQYTHNFKDLIETNKKNMVISMPDLSNDSTNMQVLLHFKYGCQMPCMNFQNMDSNLEYYLEYFNKTGSAFVLKPKELRYIPVMMKEPTPQDPKLSYARRVIKKPYFKHEI
jgi:hypothetical protein